MVLPAPVSPVTTVSPGCRSRTASSMTPRSLDPHSSSTGTASHGAGDRGGLLTAAPRRATRGPSRSNLATSRSVNGTVLSRASRTGVSDRDAPRSGPRAAGRPRAGRRTRARRCPGCRAPPRGPGATAAEDERPGEQRVRADRHQQHRLDVRPDHRARRPRTRTPSSRSGVATTTPSQPQSTAAGRRPRRPPRASARGWPSPRSTSLSAQLGRPARRRRGR